MSPLVQPEIAAEVAAVSIADSTAAAAALKAILPVVNDSPLASSIVRVKFPDVCEDWARVWTAFAAAAAEIT
ncbi:MAG: hypothetical protein ACYSWO_21770 [Planctomycetota bacterium]